MLYKFHRSSVYSEFDGAELPYVSCTCPKCNVEYWLDGNSTPRLNNAQPQQNHFTEEWMENLESKHELENKLLMIFVAFLIVAGIVAAVLFG
jgi:hypothetical protein